MAMRGHRAAWSAALLMLLGSTACASSPGEPSVGASSPVVVEGAAPNGDLATQLGIADPPEVEVVRETTPTDHHEALSACLQDDGWSAKLLPDGTIEVGPFSPEQEAAYNRAYYVCAMQYPMAEIYTAELTHAQHGIVYEHLRDKFVPCVDELGIELGALPSLEAYLADPGKDWMGDVTPQLKLALADGRFAYPNEWLVICPPSPPTEVLYGTG